MRFVNSTVEEGIKWASLIVPQALAFRALEFQAYFQDWIFFVISIILASLANVLFFSREQKVSFKIIIRHLFLSFFVGWIAYLIGKNFDLSFELRLIIVSLMAFLSEFFLKWLSEKYPKIFNRGLDKILPPNDSNNDLQT